MLILGGTSLAMADVAVLNEQDPFDIVQQESTGDVFSKEKPIFDSDNVYVFATEISEVKENVRVVPEEKVIKNTPIKVVGTRTRDAMLAINGDSVKVNPQIFSDDLCRDCLQLTEYLYLGTKRYVEDKRVYPGAFRKKTNLPRPPLYETLKGRKIKIFAPIYGTNGGQEGAYIGMLAYRDYRKQGEKRLELFVVFEGSQGEPFEFLGGIGGASWRTNFQSNKVEVDAQKLNLDKKHGKLCFHEGYYNKIYTSKIFLEEKLEELFSRLGIKEFSEFKSQKSGNVTQKDVDNWRGFSVDVYIFGHSQGGGLTQIGAPYVTATIGRWLYGDAFDNKTFNVCHAICMSPARAIGDQHTLEVLLDVMGNGNIFGWCSPIDAIPCLPLGENVSKGHVEKLGMIVAAKILKAISKFLPKKWSELISLVSETKDCYETLPIFAYVDYAEVLEKYCDIGISVYREYLDVLQKTGAIGDKGEIGKQIENLEEIKKKIPEIKDTVALMQENYFKAHTSKWFTSKYYALKAVHYLKKLLLKLSQPSDLIGSQHWGAPVKLQNPENNQNIWIETLFCSKLLDSNVQENLDRGMEYEKRKRSIIEW